MSALVTRMGEIRAAAENSLTAAGSADELEAVRIRYLGRKGELTQALSEMSRLPADERPTIGGIANEAKRAIEARLKARRAGSKRLSRSAPAGRGPRRNPARHSLCHGIPTSTSRRP